MIRDYLLLLVAYIQFGREPTVSIWDGGGSAAWRLTSGLPVRQYRHPVNWQEKTNKLEQYTASGRPREEKEDLDALYSQP